MHRYFSRIYYAVYGGRGGVRTHAPCYGPNALAVRPLDQLEYSPIVAEGWGVDPHTAQRRTTCFQDRAHRRVS